MISHRMSSRKLRTLLLARMMMMMFTGVCFTNGCVQRERRCVYSMMIKTVDDDSLILKKIKITPH